MEQKKYPHANLEKKKIVFFQIGLIATLAIVWLALEWKTYDQIEFSLGSLNKFRTFF